MGKAYLDFLFYPESVAIVGAPANTEKPSVAQHFLKNLIDFGYEGNIYPVHHAGGEIMGMKVYPNIKDVPGNVDYVISATG